MKLFKDVSLLELITILVAISALLLPSIRNWYSEWRRLKETKKYILVILNGALSPLKSKIEGLEKLVESVKNTESKTHSFYQYSTYYFDIYNKISHKDLYKIFVLNSWFLKKELKISHFDKLNKAIGFLLKYNEIEKQNMTKFIEDRRRYEKNYKTNLNTILRKSDFYKSKNDQNKVLQKDDQFLVKFINLTLKWNENKDKNLFNTTQTMLINPLNELCKKNGSDDRAMEILPLTINCDYEYSDIVNLHLVHLGSLTEALETIKNQVTSIQDFLHYYSG